MANQLFMRHVDLSGGVFRHLNVLVMWGGFKSEVQHSGSLFYQGTVGRIQKWGRRGATSQQLWGRRSLLSRLKISCKRELTVAGRKQHFIPQALQRGFGVVAGKATRVYVFKKGQEAYRSSTEGVAAARDFYSEPSDEQSIDDKITDYEGKVLAPAIAAMREAPEGPVESHLAAAVVVHLSIRSAFFRGTYSAAATELLDHFLNAMHTEESARALLEVDSFKPDSMLLKLIEEKLLTQFGSIPEGSRKALTKLFHFRAREKLPQMFPDLAAQVLQRFKFLLEIAPEMVASGHAQALGKDLVPVRRVERLKAMNWQIVSVKPPGYFVLPDCLAVGSKTSDFQNLESYSLLNDDELAGVVMPICSGKVLVGSSGEPALDLAALNRSFARCSMDFFISSQADADTTQISDLIGSNFSEHVDRMMEDYSFAAPERSSWNNGSQTTDPGASAKYIVPIKFEPSGRASGKARATLRRLLNAPELQCGMRTVEAIVVSDDVPRSLRQRGVPLDHHGEQMVKLGTCHTTEAADGVSSLIFVATDAVKNSAPGNPLSRAYAALIRHQAGRATYYAVVAAKVSKASLQKQRPLLEAVGLRIAHFVSSHYFGGRLSGIGQLSNEEFAATDTFFNQALADSMQGISHARLQFFEHRNVDATLSQALVHTERLLCATASACATTVDTTDRWETSKSIASLQAVGLGDWLELFALDLERYFSSYEYIMDDSSLLLLGSHVERVLWSFGIVLTMRIPEQIWMEVHSDEQLAHTRQMLCIS